MCVCVCLCIYILIVIFADNSKREDNFYGRDFPESSVNIVLLASSLVWSSKVTAIKFALHKFYKTPAVHVGV
jgi:hypothetical protein